ncbi:hypothetical protein GCM10010298_70270 [Streptomyces microflavus]|uniref:Uncharacterized protein n=1 Tax=Streptomyces microflavus TaxID=1919 RepID=A0A7J0D5L8_STRMI|nr:hypothetical protein Smic_83150 [Streptomyces microflavus]GGX94779.1 hypothetical protein GCM10010298_70270 [Streptomyces microflavus]
MYRPHHSLRRPPAVPPEKSSGSRVTFGFLRDLGLGMKIMPRSLPSSAHRLTVSRPLGAFGHLAEVSG